MKTNDKNGKAKSVSKELYDLCNEFMQSTEMATAMDTFANWNGELLVGELPPDAPVGLRESIEAVTRLIADGKPLFDALVKRLEDIQNA